MELRSNKIKKGPNLCDLNAPKSDTFSSTLYMLASNSSANTSGDENELDEYAEAGDDNDDEDDDDAGDDDAGDDEVEGDASVEDEDNNELYDDVSDADHDAVDDDASVAENASGDDNGVSSQANVKEINDTDEFSIYFIIIMIIRLLSCTYS